MCAEDDGWPKRGWRVAGEGLGGWWVAGGQLQENARVAGVAGLVRVWYGVSLPNRTEPNLRNTGNTYTAKHRIRIGIDRTARLEPCERVLWKCQEKEAIWAR